MSDCKFPIPDCEENQCWIEGLTVAASLCRGALVYFKGDGDTALRLQQAIIEAR
jgi:hypothetical protein